MVDMTRNKEEQESFITNINKDNDSLVVSYASGNETTERFSLHNMNYYRGKMEEQANMYVGKYLDKLSIKSFSIYVARVSSIILGLFSLFLSYNIDIHIIMKILLTILVALLEFGYYIYSDIKLDILYTQALEGMATEYYLNNIDDFKYKNPHTYEFGYIVPIEEISKMGLTEDWLKAASEKIKELISSGIEKEDISLSLSKK